MYTIYLQWADGQGRVEGRAKDPELATAIADNAATLYEDAKVIVDTPTLEKES